MDDFPQMPALFIGHGSPMNALELNNYTKAWRRIGQALPRPRAILCISAHWFIDTTAVTVMPRPRTIHDFHGFPEELFAFQYPALGLPDLVEEVAELARPQRVSSDIDQWGLDHGTWSVLAHMFPQADIPVVQLSMNAQKPLDYHLDLGARLAPLRDTGVLILSSGNVVHNLHRLQWSMPDDGEVWAKRFDEAVIAQMYKAPADLLNVTAHIDYVKAVPTPEHFIPLFYTAGLSVASKQIAKPLVRGYSLGTLSMTCYGVGMSEFHCEDHRQSSAFSE